MTFPVVGSNIPTPYQISNSLRFNDNDSPYLSKSFSTVTSTKKFTVSFWFKPSAIPQSNYSGFLDVGGDNAFALFSDSTIYFFEQGGAQFYWRPQRLFRDCNAWYHIVLACDSTLSTQTDRVKIYVNGVRETSFHNNSGPSQNYDFGLNTTSNTRYIGTKVSTSSYYDGYLAEYYQIDGQQLQASDFGEFDENSGVWKPKIYEGTFGDAGYYLKFNNTGNLGEDSSGNDNTFTPTNLSGTTDVTTDTPTNNFATWNKNMATNSTMTLAEGNLEGKTGSNYANGSSNSWFSTIGVSSGKWYAEFKLSALSGSNAGMVGVGYDLSKHQQGGTSGAYGLSDIPEGYGYIGEGNVKNNGSALSGTWNTYTTNDIIGVALDLDNNRLYFSKNGTFENSANPTDGTNAISITANKEYFFAMSDVSLANTYTFQANFGNPVHSISSGNSDANGYGNFEYSVPSGYLALCTQNLATELSPTIDDGSQYFNTVLYTGDGNNGRTVTGLGFQSDWTWIKSRNRGDVDHILNDSTRGAGKNIYSNATYPEDTSTNKIVSFDSDGLTLNNHVSVNGSSDTYVAWNWLANGGTTSSNTDGSITSTVQANTTAGFSVVTYTGTGSAGTVGHGLGATPDAFFVKSRTNSETWRCWFNSFTGGNNIRLDSTAAVETDTNVWNNSLPTSTILNLGSSGSSNGSSQTYVAYCFADIEGYSKFGSYTGNGSSDGTFVYTGFRPAWVMVKRSNDTGYWVMFDNTRQTENENNSWLLANDTSDEGTNSTGMDFVSNGFKLRNSSTGGVHNNISSSTYIYMAFAENPFVTSGATPVTAR